MLKLNNKGLTLIELLLSIVLIAMVLIFIFGLLVDVREEKESNNFAYDNQLNRIDATYKIGHDIFNHTLLGIYDISDSGGTKIQFTFKDDAIQGRTKITRLEITKDSSNKYYVNYTDYDGKKNKWEMKNATIDECGKFMLYKDSTKGKYYFRLNLYVYNKNTHDFNKKEHNNLVDDLEFSYLGNITEFQAGLTNLLNNPKNNIGKC